MGGGWQGPLITCTHARAPTHTRDDACSRVAPTWQDDVHVDRFEWKSEKTPDGVDRFAAWGPMGGVLSSKMLPCERPLIEVLQDETIVRQYDCQKKCWRHEGNARVIAPKGEGAAIMLSGMITEVDGGFPVLTQQDVDSFNAARPAHARLTREDVADLLSHVDAEGVPIPSPKPRAAAAPPATAATGAPAGANGGGAPAASNEISIAASVKPNTPFDEAMARDKLISRLGQKAVAIGGTFKDCRALAQATPATLAKTKIAGVGADYLPKLSAALANRFKENGEDGFGHGGPADGAATAGDGAAAADGGIEDAADAAAAMHVEQPKHTASDLKGTPTSELFVAPNLMQLEIGKNKEGYWTGEHQVRQVQLAHRLLSIKYPWCGFAYVFDWSSGHHAFAADALVANRMNAGPGGKQPVMHDTSFLVSEAGVLTRNLTLVPEATPPRFAQRLTFREGDVLLTEKVERTLSADDPLVGKAKGAVQAGRERGALTPDMSMKGPVIKGGATLRDDEADVLEGEDGREDEEEKGIERDLSKSIVHVLSRFSDFASEMCLLENAIVELGGLCTWLPKFHAPCNAIEYVWGNGKKRNRKDCDFTMATLRTSAFRAMMLTEPATVRKYFRKARAYQQALRAGADAFSMHKDVAKIKKERYVSHRRPAPSQFDAE